MLALIIDVVLALILIVSVWRGVSKGLILSVVGLVGVVAVFFAARYVADNYADQFRSVISPLVSTTVTDAATEERMERGIEYDNVSRGTLESAARSVFERLGIYENALDDMARDVAESAYETETSFRDAVADKFEGTLAYIFVFVIAYLLLGIVVAVIVNLCNILFKLPGLKWLNYVAGGIFGLAVGLMIVFAIAWAARYVSLLSQGEILKETTLLKYFAENNPFNQWIVIQ